MFFFLLPKYNILSPWWPTGHIGDKVAHMSAHLGMKLFSDETQKAVKNGVQTRALMVIESPYD
jgi:hypothetical protein